MNRDMREAGTSWMSSDDLISKSSSGTVIDVECKCKYTYTYITVYILLSTACVG